MCIRDRVSTQSTQFKKANQLQMRSPNNSTPTNHSFSVFPTTTLVPILTESQILESITYSTNTRCTPAFEEFMETPQDDEYFIPRLDSLTPPSFNEKKQEREYELMKKERAQSLLQSNTYDSCQGQGESQTLYKQKVCQRVCEQDKNLDRMYQTQEQSMMESAGQIKKKVQVFRIVKGREYRIEGLKMGGCLSEKDTEGSSSCLVNEEGSDKGKKEEKFISKRQRKVSKMEDIQVKEMAISEKSEDVQIKKKRGRPPSKHKKSYSGEEKVVVMYGGDEA
eukprot:TRINITY_DN1413_c0_g1_i1.p1 TRINITY_DN1413_c0_g1~~TRINITY_DN1413_c0_g1_i1.p1  ORF type:complete len:279 (+),score=39.79 TRINITY_DN1413_c0_g1_i1:68-904(+)